MIIHYKYDDTSGRRSIRIDAKKADAYHDRIERCPRQVLTIDTVVNEAQRTRMRIAGASCHGGKEIPYIHA